MMSKYMQQLYAFLAGGGSFPAPESDEDLEILSSIYVGARQLVSTVDDFMASEFAHETLFSQRDEPKPPEVSKPPRVVHLTCWRPPRLDMDN